MRRITRTATIAAVILAAGAVASSMGAQAPAAPADMAALRDQMVSMNRSMDKLVTLFAEFKADQTRTNRGTLLLRRIELAQRAVGSVTAELDAARAELRTQKDLIARSQGQIESIRLMSLQDRTGSATAAFDAERASATQAGEQAQQAAAQAEGRVSVLEQDVAARRAAIAGLEAMLDRELGK